MPEWFRKFIDELPAGATDDLLEWLEETDADEVVDQITSALMTNPT